MTGSAASPSPEQATHDNAQPDEDLRLLRAVARGDGEALGGLYDRQSPRLHGIAIKMLGAGGDAEEVLHDVFLEVWDRAGDFDPSRGSVRTWLTVRLRSRCLDRLRKARRRPEAPPPTYETAGAGLDATDIEMDVAAREVREALLALSAAQREVVVLAYYRGASSSQIAETLKIPIGTVKSRMAAALKALRAVFADGPGDGASSRSPTRDEVRS